ncbi:uncharacterized protein LOC112569245 isoform X3 [Pomacea canaliculata]|uniref:uncharacterized protein LOC112569245 isoform X3 n=1 Tax=Pomacea canaliculata TaxID=400727 RepID=UPI000D72D95E|nr:uncharacterized protein LOC112569245 isoform X3 [Pomacea canaliculata]
MPGALIFILSVMFVSVCKVQVGGNNNDTTKSNEILSTPVSTLSGEDFVNDDEYEDYTTSIESSTTVFNLSGMSYGHSTTRQTLSKKLSTHGHSNETSTVEASHGKGSTAETTHHRSGVHKISTPNNSTTKNKDSHHNASTHVGLIIGITVPVLLLVVVIAVFFLRCLCKTKKVDLKEHVYAVDGGDENMRRQYIGNEQQKAVGTEQDPMIVRLDHTAPLSDSGDYIKLQSFRDECLSIPDAEQTDMNINGDQVEPPCISHTDIVT